MSEQARPEVGSTVEWLAKPLPGSITEAERLVVLPPSPPLPEGGLGNEWSLPDVWTETDVWR